MCPRSWTGILWEYKEGSEIVPAHSTLTICLEKSSLIHYNFEVGSDQCFESAVSIPLSGEVKLSIGNEGRSELGFEGGVEDGPVGIKKGFQT